MSLRKRSSLERVRRVSTPVGLAALALATLPSSIGYQDLASLIAQRSNVSDRWRAHGTAPYSTVQATFGFSRPIGTQMPGPIGTRVASLELDRTDLTGSIAPRALFDVNAALPDIDLDMVNRARKGDRTVPRAMAEWMEREKRAGVAVQAQLKADAVAPATASPVAEASASAAAAPTPAATETTAATASSTVAQAAVTPLKQRTGWPVALPNNPLTSSAAAPAPAAGTSAPHNEAFAASSLAWLGAGSEAGPGSDPAQFVTAMLVTPAPGQLASSPVELEPEAPAAMAVAPAVAPTGTAPASASQPETAAAATPPQATATTVQAAVADPAPAPAPASATRLSEAVPAPQPAVVSGPAGTAPARIMLASADVGFALPPSALPPSNVSSLPIQPADDPLVRDAEIERPAAPTPGLTTARIYFGAESLADTGTLQPWTPANVSILGGTDADFPAEDSNAALNPNGGQTIAAKGVVMPGDGHGLRSPAERLGLAGAERNKAEKCLAEAVYFESRGEPQRGQIAVAQVVMNRVFSGYYPDNVCGVVYQNAHRHLSCQFTFACDGIKDRVTEPDAWERAQQIARETLDGEHWLPDVGKATHYHARWVHPWWVRTMNKLERIGVHTFYRPRRWGDGADRPAWGDAPLPPAAEKL